MGYKIMKQIINCETGEITERELTKAEKDQQKIDETEMAKLEALQKAQAEAKAQTKAAAEGKLAALGLTTDDLRALGL
jgi:predicted negative regulator of RcsB-dependent stress response